MMSTRRSIRRAVIAFVSFAGLSASCGVPTGPESFQEIDGADVPNRLNDTTTTTTTTLPSTTTTTSLLDTPPSTTSSTETPNPTEIVDIFFVSRGQLAPKPTAARAPVSANELIDLLEAGSGSDLLDTEILLNLIESTSEDNGILTIELNDLVFERIPVRDQREAIAQMVLTFLSNLRGVGQAVFTIDGERLTVPIDGSRVSDQPVSLDDYATMLIDADPVDDPVEVPATTDPAALAPTSVP